MPCKSKFQIIIIKVHLVFVVDYVILSFLVMVRLDKSYAKRNNLQSIDFMYHVFILQ